ncbi:biofilm regulation protein phosphatase SiaA [Achromobacter ruhlandii]|uniref:biofilm regulation protein phosphatase SiaA n=1 Tax=Achromobacter ruhlandii TaxID=72557 RepID=UPI0006C3A2CA|nr:biofilm regulation protein phosphatase SiaA [Achromobacter ruhlandii]CUJ49026.1 nitrate/nitrite sensor protein NarQ [Achromobacter ruhlandii]CUJ52410.1 nitrate/nitrite sensor protein NarQ [Achromobacter ruhlandii]CUK17151.1 nitrate/nitrite sensor protein NarQ [Achromobacter ruhlandii]
MAKWGLRKKSLMALLLACLVALAPAALIGWQVLDGVRDHFGRAFADNFTQLNRQRILAPVSRELALSQRLADSEVTRRWLRNESDPAARELFFREADGYRRDLLGRAYFIASAATGHYYFNDDQPLSEAPRYTLSRDAADDGWFYNSLKASARYNINVNPDLKLKTTRVWINVQVRDGDKVIGLTGAGLDVGGFLRDFVNSGQPGVTPIIVDEEGAIQAHMDPTLIAYNSGAGGAEGASGRGMVFNLLDPGSGRDELRSALHAAQADPQSVQSAWVTIDGVRQLVSVAYMPELHWHVLTVVDLGAARVLDTDWLWPAAIGLVLLFAALLLCFGYAIERLMLRPLRRLQQSARAIANGSYDVRLPPGGQDEIGDLSRAFGVMADKVRQHTAELESKVRERTSELEDANRAMAAAHKKIGDSIDYASLIQRAILPDRQLTQSLGAHHFVLWKPRDVVGGDFYVFRSAGANCLLGIMDCAGHGVPGALMTMLARAAIDLAITEAGPADPAGILARTDSAIRAMLADAQLPRALATNTDAGLVYIDRQSGSLRYAGAKISLYASDGETLREVPGGKRALGDKRTGTYQNIELRMEPGWTYYLATDGFLDQAGGEHGFGFGNTRFAEMLKRHARQPLTDQAAAFTEALARYQGGRPQRDDITLLSFRFE